MHIIVREIENVTWSFERFMLRNKKRLYGAEHKCKETSKKRCQLIRGLKKGKDDKDIEHEGTVYDAGAF